MRNLLWRTILHYVAKVQLTYLYIFTYCDRIIFPYISSQSCPCPFSLLVLTNNCLFAGLDCLYEKVPEDIKSNTIKNTFSYKI